MLDLFLQSAHYVASRTRIHLYSKVSPSSCIYMQRRGALVGEFRQLVFVCVVLKDTRLVDYCPLTSLYHLVVTQNRQKKGKFLPVCHHVSK